MRWWSALALLRSLASSPAAAAATLRTRAGSADAEPSTRPTRSAGAPCSTSDDDEAAEGIDVAPGGDPARRGRRRTAAAAELQRRWLAQADGARRRSRTRSSRRRSKLVKELLDDGFNPIVFCRFIPTAEYVAEHLRAALRKKVEVEAVTGLLASGRARGARRCARHAHERRVLVGTDCLSEGINLQDHFDAVVHYDLAWNPTRHEQREGRVDRFGQKRKTVRVLTYYGDRQRDRRHRARGAAPQAPARSASSLGIASRCR